MDIDTALHGALHLHAVDGVVSIIGAVKGAVLHHLDAIHGSEVVVEQFFGPASVVASCVR